MTQCCPASSIFEFGADALDAYERDGVVCLRSAFSIDWIHRATAAAERHLRDIDGHLERVWSGQKRGGGREYSYMSRGSSEFRALALALPAPLIAARLMRSRQVRFWFDHLLPKEPIGTAEVGERAPLVRKGTNWHNDLPVWPLRGDQVITLWIALTPTTSASSGMEYVRGSHRWGGFRCFERGRVMGRADHPLLPDIDAMRQTGEAEVISWELEPGDCVCHHGFTVHGTGPNRTDRHRLAIAFRFLGDDVLWEPSDETIATPVVPRLGPGDRTIDDDLFPSAWPSVAAC